MEKPNMPSLLPRACKTSFDLLRRAECQKLGFACVIAIGRAE